MFPYCVSSLSVTYIPLCEIVDRKIDQPAIAICYHALFLKNPSCNNFRVYTKVLEKYRTIRKLSKSSHIPNMLLLQNTST